MSKAKLKMVLATPYSYVFKVTRGQVEAKRLHFQKYRPCVVTQGQYIMINREAYWHGVNSYLAVEPEKPKRRAG